MEEDYEKRISALLQYDNSSDNNIEGIISVGRQFDFWGDAKTELMILNDGDESLCLGYKSVKFFDSMYVGDQMNFKATIIEVGNSSRTCKVQSFRVAISAKRIGVKGAKDNDLFYCDEPQLIGEGTVTLVVKKIFNVEINRTVW